MKKSKTAVGVLALAIAAVGIKFIVPTQSTNETVHLSQITKGLSETSSEVLKPQFSGVTMVSSSLMSVLNNYKNSTDLDAKTGITANSSLGISVALSEYASFLSTSTDTKAAVQALDVATKMVPEGSVIAGYNNLGVSNVDSYLNIRENPGTDQKVKGKMPGNAACEILEEKDGWYKVRSGSVTGYVASEFILKGYDANVKAMQTMKTELVVTGDVLNVRQEPSTSCSVSTSVSSGEHLEIVEDVKDGWYKVNINNLTGYVSAEFVQKVNTLPVAAEIVEVVVNTKATTKISGPKFNTGNLDQTVSQTAKDIIEYSMQFLGNPYVYGGNSLTNGTDCSGFVKLIFAQYGYSLPRSSGDYIGVGTQIPYSSAKPGDIIVYKYGSSIGHVAIYIGNGQIVHASTPSGGIRIGSATFVQPYCAVRVLP
jgi:cell wall-associated NlpC family hydrolase